MRKRYSSVKSGIERNGRDKEKINALKEHTHARFFADMGALFYCILFGHAQGGGSVIQSEKPASSAAAAPCFAPPRRGHCLFERRGRNAGLERTRNGGSAKAAEVCAPCTTFMRNEIGCSLFCGDETVPQIFWIRHSFFMLFVSNPLCSEKLQLKLRHSLDKREECGTMGVR